MTLFLGGRCELSCPTCDCRVDGWSEESIDRELEGGGARVLVRGVPCSSPALESVVRKAKESGFSQVVVRTNAVSLGDPGAAEKLLELGVDGALVPLFSHRSDVHDRVAGKPESLVHALRGLRALSAVGLGAEVEIPLLPSRIQRAADVVKLAHRAVPSLRAVRFYLPRFDVPLAVAPPPWSVGAPLLAEALRLCRELGIEASFGREDGVPLCALADVPELGDAYRLDPRPRSQPPHGCSYPDVCRSCAVKRQCAGVTVSYSRAHGDTDIRPYPKRPPTLGRKRPKESWTPERRRAARTVRNVVFRPTVNCNQDCPFCSANETSNNVWPDADDMIRRIARIARTGARRVSFSGGEPTLSRHLPSYISVAHRLGVKEIELVTNGTLLDSQKRVARLAEAGLTNAFVSLHGHDDSLSRMMTAKIGDFDKTVRAIELLLAAGVETEINHVISSRNYRYLTHFVEFVRERFGGRADISFAFITPQFKALENMDLVPKLSDVLPHARVAMRRALEISQPFHVGSRQGIPPCLLGEFQAWSDVLKVGSEAGVEDAQQKIRAPGCEKCRYTSYCTGLWRPYALRYGLDELTPIEGPAFDEDDARRLLGKAYRGWFGTPLSFEQAPDELRDRNLEKEALAVPTAEPLRRLPVVQLPDRTRPLRIAIAGTGRRARHLARAAQNIEGVSVDAVASPHAPDMAPPEFAGCPTYRSLVDALDDMRPDAVVVAAATHVHHELALAALERGIPTLVEKPVGRSPEEALSLGEAAARHGTLVMPAHNIAFSPGIEHLFGPDVVGVSWTQRMTTEGSGTPLTWSRSSMGELFYHVMVLLERACGSIRGVDSVQLQGSGRPRRLESRLTCDRGSAIVQLDFASRREELAMATWDAAENKTRWRRADRRVEVLSPNGERLPVGDGGDAERMLASFRDAFLGRQPPLATMAHAATVARGAAMLADALMEALPKSDRREPKHVRSPGL